MSRPVQHLAVGLASLGLLFAPVRLCAAAPRERPWFEQVERARDRGAGRVVDDPAWETQRLRETRDERLGRRQPSREFDRLGEERDRRLQLDAGQRRQLRPLLDAGRDKGSVILNEPPRAGGTVTSPIAAQAAADERALGEAKERLERSLRGVNVGEQRALRTLRRRLNREGRAGEYVQQSAPVRERHERLREGHHADYQQLRILGRP